MRSRAPNLYDIVRTIFPNILVCSISSKMTLWHVDTWHWQIDTFTLTHWHFDSFTITEWHFDTCRSTIWQIYIDILTDRHLQIDVLTDLHWHFYKLTLTDWQIDKLTQNWLTFLHFTWINLHFDILTWNLIYIFTF